MIRQNPIQTRCGETRAFTLTELLIVMVLLSILSATALPALGRLDNAQRAGLLHECERLVTLSQALAASTGTPSGVRFDLSEQTATVVSVDLEQSGVQAVVRTGSGRPLEIPASAFPGARISSAGLIGAPIGVGITTIWFDFDGTPQSRGTGGDSPENITSDFIVQIEEAGRLSIAPISGRVIR